MKIAIVLNSGLNTPHLKIYTSYFDKKGIDYDVISWDEEGRDVGSEFIFPAKINYMGSRLSRLLIIFKFAIYCKKLIDKYKYDKLVVIGPQLALLFPFYLKRKYRNKFIFDYRDLSIDQIPIFKPLMKMLLKSSFANIISSPGFIKYLPKGYNYVISHNFDVDLVKKNIGLNYTKTSSDVIKVLTIGAIRLDSNIEVIDALGNAKGFELSFVGKGAGSADILKAHAKEKGFTNINFEGQYKKEDEGAIIKRYQFVNIFYPKWNSHVSALSNRFYNSLIYKVPMIVTKGGTQGFYADKYGVGLAVDSCDDLPNKLRSYYDSLDYSSYQLRCNNLLQVFLRDYDIFAKVVDAFIEL